MTTRHKYDHQRAMLRHGASLCYHCNGDGMVWEDIVGDWEILRTLEYECDLCGGTGLYTEEMNTHYRLIRRISLAA